MPIVEVIEHHFTLYAPSPKARYGYLLELDPGLYYEEFSEQDFARQKHRWDAFVRGVSWDLLRLFVRDHAER